MIVLLLMCIRDVHTIMRRNLSATMHSECTVICLINRQFFFYNLINVNFCNYITTLNLKRFCLVNLTETAQVPLVTLNGKFIITYLKKIFGISHDLKSPFAIMFSFSKNFQISNGLFGTAAPVPPGTSRRQKHKMSFL